MIKSVFAATAALSMSAGAAFAGPYVNVETNAGWTGSDYSGAVTDFHVGTRALWATPLPTTSKAVLPVTPDGGTDEPFLLVRQVSACSERCSGRIWRGLLRR